MANAIAPSKLASLVEEIYQEHRYLAEGELASYIPELGKVDPRGFAISVTTIDGQIVTAGNKDQLFTIQSISKPFVFGLALETHGLAHVRSRVNVEPTGEPFHSMIRLDESSKRPPNPLVNSGAIAMTSLIKGKNPQAGREAIKNMYELYTGRSLDMDEAVYESEKLTGHRNRAIAHLMLHFGMVEPEIEETVDLYFRQCSFNINASDLSTMAATLANKGINPLTGKRAIAETHVKSLLTLMLTCGLYTYAGEWAFNVGLPAKSGVSGGILAAVPGKMGIGVYSPLVDRQGNSVRGVRVFKDLERALNLHIFH
jgi:glutaminase